MTILLTQNLRVGGVVLNSGTTQTFGADLEADIVARKGATYLTDPTPGKTVPVVATTDVTGMITKIYAGGKSNFAEIVIGAQLVDVVHTGTIAETILCSFLIRANTIIVPAALRMVSGLRYVTTATAGNRTIRIKLNTTNSLSGATTLCSNLMSTQSVTQGVVRTDQIIFDGAATQKGSAVLAGWNAAQGNDWSSGALAVNADIYLLVSCQLIDVADSFTMKSFVASLLQG